MVCPGNTCVGSMYGCSQLCYIRFPILLSLSALLSKQPSAAPSLLHAGPDFRADLFRSLTAELPWLHLGVSAQTLG